LLDAEFDLVPLAKSSQVDELWLRNATAAQVDGEQRQVAKLFTGRAATPGFVIGVVTEAIPGRGILHQIGLDSLLSRA
jgi:hypothetical protein